MSAPEESTDPDRASLAGRCFFAPIDLVSELPGLLPRAIERGRGQIKLAQALGRLVVEHSLIGARPALRQPASDAPPPTRSAHPPPSPTDSVTPEPDEPTPPAPLPTAATSDPTIPVDDLALPDYDSLSASQVIPRLQGLEPAELEDLRCYEAAGRSRRTILNKIAQLQSSP
jgi:hypothetical protein